MAIILGLIFFVATLFLKVSFAWIAGFICLFAIAGYVGNLERTVDVKKWKLVTIQASIIILGTLLQSIGLYPVWRKEMAASMEGALLGANEPFAPSRIVVLTIVPFLPASNLNSASGKGLSLEILDSSLHVVFQLRLAPDAVQVQGEWWDNQGNGKRMLEDANSKGSVVEYLGPRQRKDDDLIKPIFVYPSSDHWEELVKNPAPHPVS